MQKSTILVVDFQPIVRDGIISMLEAADRFEIFEADTDEKVIKNCTEHAIDVAIMDIRVSEPTGIPLVKKLTTDFVDTKILVLMETTDQHTIKQLHQEGVFGYLLKDSGREELLKAVDSLTNETMYFSNKITLSVMQNRGDTPANNQINPGMKASLTDRELEVLELIINEHTNPEIAEKLSISVRTVDTHRRNLLQKTGVRNTAGLVRCAIKNDLLS